MVEVVCQRCGEKNEHDDYKEARFKLKHAKGCGSGIGIVVVSSKATAAEPKAETPKKVLDTSEYPEDLKPKKVKRKKKSE